jgi:hypothetical protein
MPSAILLTLVLAAPGSPARPATLRRFDLAAHERPRVVAAAARYLEEDPRTITAARSARSAGGPHDFFSEGDYWWPDPKNPDGPYVQRDGMTNPDNFVEHRRALMRLSVQVPALAAAFRLTGDGRYALHAGRHLRAWFVDAETRMAPHLRYAQAIHGITTGRAQGVIDTLHLVEVARAIEVLDQSPALSLAERDDVRGWFREYLRWLTTDENALAERDAKNNHATCWLLQVAAFAHLVGDEKEMAAARERFKTVIVPSQVAADGSFPEELRRTKPYGYSLFNLEALAGVAQTLSTQDDNLWTFEGLEGRGLRKAMAYMVPYIRDKNTWPKAPDVMYDAEWPMRQASLLFGGLALAQPEYVALWQTLPADSNVEEVIRNFFIRQPVLWIQVNARRGRA